MIYLLFVAKNNSLSILEFTDMLHNGFTEITGYFGAKFKLQNDIIISQYFNIVSYQTQCFKVFCESIVTRY